MTVFLIIVILAILLRLAAAMGLTGLKSFKDHLRAATGGAFVLTGISHFLIPEKFMEMMPPFLPAPMFLIYLSGFFEILGGTALIVPKTKQAAGAFLILLLLAVFPANIYVALNNVQLGGYMNYELYQWIRLPMQFALIALIWWSAEIYRFWRNEDES